MGPLWKIALRNTARHKRRTIITTTVMAAGIAFFVFFDSTLSGMDRMTVDNMAAYTTSALKLRTPAYVDDIAATPIDEALPDPEGALAAVAAAGLHGTPRLRFVARASNYEDEVPLIADGVDPAADALVFSVARSVTEGRWLGGAGAKEAVIGADLAAELGLGVGDGILVAAETVHESTNADEYEIVGLVRTPAPELNRSGLFLGIDAARELLDGPGLATEVDVAIPRAANLDADLSRSAAAAAELGRALPGLRADPLGELVRDYLAMRNMKAKFSFIFIFVVLLIAAVGIANTILMSVYARVREIGVLRAYGMTRRDISRLFTLEGLCIGLLGSAFGVLLGAGLVFLMVRWGIDLDAWMGDLATGSVPMSGILRGVWNPATMVVGFLFGIAVSVVSARVPARMAAKMEPTDALRFV